MSLGVLAAAAHRRNAGGGVPSISYIGNNSSTANASTYTFTAEPIGVEANRDYVLIVVFSRDSSTGTSVSSLTVGGVSATQRCTVNWDDGGNSSVVAVYSVAVTGTTADVVVNLSTTMLRCGIGVFTVKAVASLVPYDTSTANSTSGTSLNLDCDTPSGDSFLLAAFLAANADTTMAWTGPSESYEGFFESFNVSAATNTHGSAGTQTVTATAGVASPIGGFAITFQ